ncbi:DUF1801 domain-containing protein [Mucilaginibacter gotjawali]|uniref:Uncharacterized protein n=2 Tax=Mucilaginibacter gotjawali TaxID=1550579 RepID=A0A110B2K5_9SPHI|nr:DUF1801 domain-containing protein [Mucilaginibacter gotjawali]MBB3053849.1 hypothetical protein [Mucilaginibacter gotjawali]BAU54113.1 hypothetical protein MgSA37_02285 [Mucilaginibacter gotjawali]
MSKEDVCDLVKFMLPYPDHVKAAALWLRDFVWELYPDTNELIYDNYNAVAFGWSPTDKAGDVFCSIAIFKDHVNFGFNRGSEIPDRKKILSGDASLYRYIKVKNKDDFPEEDIKQLLAMAYENAISRLKPQKKVIKGETIVKSISPVKRRPEIF